MKRFLLIVLMFIGGYYYFLEYILPHESHFSDPIEALGEITLIVGIFGFLLGAIHLSRTHIHKIQRRHRDWPYSFVLLLSMVVMFVLDLWNYYSPDYSLERAYDYLFRGIFVPISATVFAFLGLYIASAAYRAFRIKTLEASVMMFIALFVMLGQISVGQELTSGLADYEYGQYFQIELIRDWIMMLWNGAAQRGLYFGVVVGGFAIGIRIWLSLEKGFFTETK